MMYYTNDANYRVQQVQLAKMLSQVQLAKMLSGSN